MPRIDGWTLTLRTIHALNDLRRLYPDHYQHMGTDDALRIARRANKYGRRELPVRKRARRTRTT